MGRRMQLGAAALLVIGLMAGCALRSLAPVEGRPIPETYVVVPGDSLSAIAWRYELDWRDIAAWNRLSNPDLIYPGQRLKLRRSAAGAPEAGAPVVAAVPPAPAPPPAPVTPLPREASSVSWRWPTEGKVVRGFQPELPGRKGIQIGGRLGQAVWPAAPGRVVYSGSGLPGYGRLIIVKHSDTFLSAYGYLGKIYVQEGDRVDFAGPIAEMGSSNENRPVLHFEIRANGKPVNPLQLLPG